MLENSVQPEIFISKNDFLWLCILNNYVCIEGVEWRTQSNRFRLTYCFISLESFVPEFSLILLKSKLLADYIQHSIEPGLFVYLYVQLQ